MMTQMWNDMDRDTGVVRQCGKTRTAVLAVAALMAAALLLDACSGARLSDTRSTSHQNPHSTIGHQNPHSGVRVAATTHSTVPVTAGTPVVVNGRFVKKVVVGGLSVSPLAGGGARPLGLDASLAASYVRITGGLAGGVADGRQVVGYGSVTLTGVSMPAGTSALSATPAWVGIAYAGTRPEAVYSCPDMHAPYGKGGPYRPVDTAVVFYGTGGDGAVLYSTGGSLPCGTGYSKPSVSLADGLVSVPWQQVGPAGLSTTVAYTVPSCATLVTAGGGGNVRTGIYTIDITVAIPFDRAGCSNIVSRTTVVRVFPSNIGPPGGPTPPAHVVLEHSIWPAFAPQGFRPPDFNEPR
jgi:hypothetical protein